MKRFLTIILWALLMGPVFAQNDLQPAAIVRLTRSEPITVKQLRTEVEQIEKVSLRTITFEERRQMLDVMINQRLVLQAAERDKVTVSDNEVNQQIQQLRAQMAQMAGRQLTDEEFAQEITRNTGIIAPDTLRDAKARAENVIAAFREQSRRQLVVQKYLQFKKQDLFNSVKNPAEAEIMQAYNDNKSQFVRPDTVRFSMIQVPAGTDAASRTKAKELADRLVREIGTNPSRFDEAVTRSTSPNSGYQAGDGGYLPRNAEAREVVGVDFLNTAFNLKQGEVSKLIESPRGFQIIKITETYEQKMLAIDDVLDLASRTTVRNFIADRMLQERQQGILVQASQELINDLRKGDPFQIYENNIKW